MDRVVDKSSKKISESTNQPTTIREQSLKINNFNPMKGSPNLFMTKLEFRLRHYHVEAALVNDPLTL